MARFKSTLNGIVPFTATEEAEWDIIEANAALDAISRAEQDVRYKRNKLLSESDWTQLADASATASDWTTYRQALRDITSHANFPNLQDADWPTKP